MESSGQTIKNIQALFDQLTDPSNSTSVRHPFTNILSITICAIISGCNNFNEIEEYGKSK
ncbi:transposase family protein [Pseudoalteromonas arctica]|uniref:Transposase family protein n=1 Tax=Pseudoalteromonas arctica TaxID=394751 RepID=A0A7Y0HD73_9GAMM|nr:transposase family protein [Pseudoalteromonas arctica]